MKNPHGISLPPQAFDPWTRMDEYPKNGLAHVYLQEGAQGVEREIPYSSEDDVRKYLSWIGMYGKVDVATSCSYLLDFKRFNSIAFRIAAFYNHSDLCRYLLPYSDPSALNYRAVSSFLVHGRGDLIKEIHENHNIPWDDFRFHIKYLIEEKNALGIQALLPYLKSYIVDDHNVFYDALLLTPSVEHDKIIELLTNNPYISEQEKWVKGGKDPFSALTYWVCHKNWWGLEMAMDLDGGFDDILKHRLEFIIKHCPVSTNSCEVIKYVISQRCSTELEILIPHLDQSVDLVKDICTSMKEGDQVFTLNAIKWQQSMRELTLKEIDQLLCTGISENFSLVVDYMLPLAHNQCKMSFATSLKHNLELFFHFAEKFNLHPCMAYSSVYGFDMADVVESPYNIDLTNYFFEKISRDDKNLLVSEACKKEKNDLVLYVNKKHPHEASFVDGLLTLLKSEKDNTEIVKEVFNRHKHTLPSWEEALKHSCWSGNTKKVDLVLDLYRQSKTQAPMSVFLYALDQGNKDITRMLWPYHNKEHFDLIREEIRKDSGEEKFEAVMKIYKELQAEEDKKALEKELGVGSGDYLSKPEGKMRVM